MEFDWEGVVGERGSGVPRLCRLMCCGGRDGVGPREGRVSMRYIRMKPVMRERPIQAWGDSMCSSFSARESRLRETTEMCEGARSRLMSKEDVSSKIDKTSLRCASPCGCPWRPTAASPPFTVVSMTGSGAASGVWGMAAELYMVSMPSGMMTTSAVPTSTPVPIVDMMRNCRCERENERGREPARNELLVVNSNIP